MRVFKFGGASVKDADGVRNLHRIITQEGADGLVIVVSAMGKTTNALEDVLQWHTQGKNATDKLESVLDFHKNVMNDLFGTIPRKLLETIQALKIEVQEHLSKEALNEHALYDSLVSLGELWSTLIIQYYLAEHGMNSFWMDARKLIETDNKHREGAVQWKQTAEKCKSIESALERHQCVVTQGFIASSAEGLTTTLGREGSDYSAAIFAHVLRAKQLTIWKDVAGVYNADPKYFDDVVKLDYVSYEEAIELAYYGASVIHPRTIQPLQDRQIELCVKSFVDPDLPGTRIGKDKVENQGIPSFIVQKGQVLITIATRDLSFIVEEHLTDIFRSFACHQIKIDIMQNSAVHFSVAVRAAEGKLASLLEDLQNRYEVRMNQNLNLLTIRHYTESVISKLLGTNEVLMEQRTRQTYRALYKAE